MQTSNVVVAATTIHRQLLLEATALLHHNGFSADGRPLNEARTARSTDVISDHNLKWKPPKTALTAYDPNQKAEGILSLGLFLY